ncbi:hypothetical protein A9Q98_10335 [Thalassotalea sp. 42_200_T64]|nr:hypothetical protein A9Q98_10335 [Thalassotalea sp. 42_200_T64]
MTSNQKSANAEQFWLNHIKQWQDSGLSQTTYCKEHDVKPHSLSYHKCKQARHQVNTQIATPTSTGFLQVAVSPVVTLPEPLTLDFSFYRIIMLKKLTHISTNYRDIL